MASLKSRIWSRIQVHDSFKLKSVQATLRIQIRSSFLIRKVKKFTVDLNFCFFGALAILDLDQEQYPLTKMNKEYTEKLDQEHNGKKGITT
jgi:hypothetical protein